MPGIAETLLWHATIILHGWLVFRFLRLGLHARYQAIFALLLLQLVRSLWLLQYMASPETFRISGNQYFFTVLFTEPVLIAARVAAVFEISTEVLRSYRGLSILGRATMAAALTASLSVSLLLHWEEFNFSKEPFRWLRVLYLLETTVYSALLIFLLLLALFVLYHPAPLRKNLLAHGIGFGVYMVSSAAAVWLRNQDASQWTRTASTLRIFLGAAGLLAWAALLSARGEEEFVDVHIPLSSETERQVLARLNALNSALERK